MFEPILTWSGNHLDTGEIEIRLGGFVTQERADRFTRETVCYLAHHGHRYALGLRDGRELPVPEAAVAYTENPF
jgi:hypothetical protein